MTLYPPLYNRRTPELFGLPFFYWYQLAVVAVGVASTYAVYRATRSGLRPDTRGADARSTDASSLGTSGPGAPHRHDEKGL